MSQQSLQACLLVVIVVLLVVTTPEVEVRDKDYWQTWAQGLEYLEYGISSYVEREVA